MTTGQPYLHNLSLILSSQTIPDSIKLRLKLTFKMSHLIEGKIESQHLSVKSVKNLGFSMIAQYLFFKLEWSK